jgi:hypothetical protein
MFMKYIPFTFLSLFFFTSCGKPNMDKTTENSAKITLVSQEINLFNDYWYSGKAELTGYKLEQNRYGEIRNGHSVMVFVTEPFSAKKQVKLDYPNQAEDTDNIPVLKLNALRKFKTGVYDYSMMNSVFTPVSLDKHPHTLKLTCSAQDWCGHSFTQLNYRDEGYQLQEFSYFESEGDKSKNLGDALLEDEIFTRLRINPASLPTESVELIPGLFFSRTAHVKLKPKKARISFKSDKEASTQCIIEYLHLDRTVKIDFGIEFPHEILSWEEIDNGKTTVRATKAKSIRSPYWERNATKYEYLRDSLGI